MSKVTDALTDENVQDIIDTASYGGITYWAGQPTDAEFDAKPEDKAWTIVEVDDFERTAHYLDAAQIRQSFEKLLDFNQELVNQQIHGYLLSAWMDRTDKDGIDTGHIDADAADVIVQVACFGEVVYG
jgi:hypothetical protein